MQKTYSDWEIKKTNLLGVLKIKLLFFGLLNQKPEKITLSGFCNV
jgi:hypothetical protein